MFSILLVPPSPTFKNYGGYEFVDFKKVPWLHCFGGVGVGWGSIQANPTRFVSKTGRGGWISILYCKGEWMMNNFCNNKIFKRRLDTLRKTVGLGRLSTMFVCFLTAKVVHCICLYSVDGKKSCSLVCLVGHVSPVQLIGLGMLAFRTSYIAKGKRDESWFGGLDVLCNVYVIAM